MKSKLLVVILFLGAAAAGAQPRVEGEILIGPTLATIGGGETIERYGGIAIGAGATFHVLEYGLGDICISVPPTLTIGERQDKEGIDFQRVHLPIGIMLTVGDNVNNAAGSIGGAVTVGYGATIGSFTNNDADIRPFVNFDVSFGIFKRGALKIRYSTVFGTYDFQDRGNVGYHSLLLVGSTEW